MQHYHPSIHQLDGHRHHCNLCSVISAAWLCVMFDVRHFLSPLVLLGSTWVLPSTLLALLFYTPQEPPGNYSLEKQISLTSISAYYYRPALFTSGTSKGTSSPLFLRISATIRRVLSLGMTFSSCIFVHTASAFFESFISSENNKVKAVGIRMLFFFHSHFIVIHFQ